MAAQHGTRTRYSAGCRCADCTAAQQEYRRAYRLRKAGAPAAAPAPAGAPAVAVPAVPGPMEAAVTARLDEIIVDVPGADVWRGMALIDARLLDSLAARNVAVGVTGLQASLAAALDRLQPAPTPQGDAARAELDAWAADL